MILKGQLDDTDFFMGESSFDLMGKSQAGAARGIEEVKSDIESIGDVKSGMFSSFKNFFRSNKTSPAPPNMLNVPAGNMDDTSKQEKVLKIL